MIDVVMVNSSLANMLLMEVRCMWRNLTFENLSNNGLCWYNEKCLNHLDISVLVFDPCVWKMVFRCSTCVNIPYLPNNNLHNRYMPLIYLLPFSENNKSTCHLGTCTCHLYIYFLFHNCDLIANRSVHYATTKAFWKRLKIFHDDDCWMLTTI